MAEMSMVEKVAKAIFETWAAEQQATGTWDEALKGHGMPSEFPEMFRVVDLARKEARAAIEAIRVTSGAMRSAGAEAGRRHTSYIDNPTAQIIFEAMLDAALSEEVAG